MIKKGTETRLFGVSQSLIVCHLFSELRTTSVTQEWKERQEIGATMKMQEEAGWVWTNIGLYIALGLITTGTIHLVVSLIIMRWRAAKQVKGFPGPASHWLKGNVDDVSTKNLQKFTTLGEHYIMVCLYWKIGIQSFFYRVFNTELQRANTTCAIWRWYLTPGVTRQGV